MAFHDVSKKDLFKNDMMCSFMRWVALAVKPLAIAL